MYQRSLGLLAGASLLGGSMWLLASRSGATTVHCNDGTNCEQQFLSTVNKCTATYTNPPPPTITPHYGTPANDYFIFSGGSGSAYATLNCSAGSNCTGAAYTIKRGLIDDGVNGRDNSGPEYDCESTHPWACTEICGGHECCSTDF